MIVVTLITCIVDVVVVGIGIGVEVAVVETGVKLRLGDIASREVAHIAGVNSRLDNNIDIIVLNLLLLLIGTKIRSNI